MYWSRGFQISFIGLTSNLNSFSHHFSFTSCNNLPVLRILSLNTYANSWFDDLPIPSPQEPYDADLVVRVSKEVKQCYKYHNWIKYSLEQRCPTVFLSLPQLWLSPNILFLNSFKTSHFQHVYNSDLKYNFMPGLLFARSRWLINALSLNLKGTKITLRRKHFFKLQESVNKPSHFTDLLNVLPNEDIIGVINEATKKKERLDRLCEMLK